MFECCYLSKNSLTILPSRVSGEEQLSISKSGIGASVPRKEDDRFLRGRGQYVGDIRIPGAREVAFVRSPVDRKSTRLNSSHSQISYAVFCLKKKNKHKYLYTSRLALIDRHYSTLFYTFLYLSYSSSIDGVIPLLALLLPLTEDHHKCVRVRD